MLSHPHTIFSNAWQMGHRHHAWLLIGFDNAHILKMAHIIQPSNQLIINKKDNVKTVKEKLHTFLQTQATEKDTRLCLLEQIDEYNPFVHNALLKCLEEPPAFTYFLATAMRVGLIPRTILSRCIHLYALPPLEGEELERETQFWQKIFEDAPLSTWYNDFLTFTASWVAMDKTCRALITLLFMRSQKKLDPNQATQALEIEHLIESAHRLYLSPKSLFFEIGRRLKICNLNMS